MLADMGPQLLSNGQTTKRVYEHARLEELS